MLTKKIAETRGIWSFYLELITLGMPAFCGCWQRKVACGWCDGCCFWLEWYPKRWRNWLRFQFQFQLKLQLKTQQVIWWCYIKLSTTDTSIIYSDKSNNHRMRWKFLWARQVDKTSLAAVRTLGLLLTNQHTKYVIWGFFEPAYTQLSIQPLLFLGPTKSPVHFSVPPNKKKRVGNFLKRNDLLPPKYTTFHHFVYVARWSLTLIYF
jgi:hypothetical protein